MDWKLFKAAASGDVSFLCQTEAHNLDFNQVTPQKSTVLHIAVNSRQKEFAKQVLRLCPSLLLKANIKGDTPLHVAARIGSLELSEILINSAKTLHEDVESQVVNGKELLRMVNLEKKETALHVAVRNGHFGVVKVLLEADVGLLDLVNNAYQSPLSLAVLGGFSGITLHILETCPSSPCGGTNGINALHAAVFQRHHAHGTLERLVKIKQELIREADKFKRTPLHYAVFYGYLEAVQEFLQCDNSAAYLSDKDEMSPLHVAACVGHVDVARELVQCCPYIWELVDDKGRTALHVAVIAGEDEMVKYILEVPELVGLINEPDKEGNSPLHLAIAYQKYSIISILSRDERVDKHAMNNEFFTAFDSYYSKKPQIDSLAVAKVYHQLDAFHGIPDTPRWVDTNLKKAMKGETVEEEKYPISFNTKECSNESNTTSFEAHLVVATLIATVTFAAAFTMPGGYKNDGPDEGMPTFRNKLAFKAFIICDTTAFCFSAAAVHLLFYASYLGYNRRPDSFHKVFLCIFMAMLSMVLAFVAGMHVMLAKSIGLAIAADVLAGYLVLIFLVEWFCDPVGYPVPSLDGLRRYFRNKLFELGIL